MEVTSEEVHDGRIIKKSVDIASKDNHMTGILADGHNLLTGEDSNRIYIICGWLCFRELPSSQHYHISKIMDLVTIVDPRSVLDVGTGFGKYGILCREYLELWDGRQKYSDFKRRIDGVEAFSPYITPLHNYVYDNLYVEDDTRTG